MAPYLVLVLQEATESGATFIFGYLAGGPLPYEETAPNMSYVFAFRVLPFIVVLSAFSSVLFYWGVLPFVIRLFAKLLRRAFNISGPLGFAAAASVFLGTIENPIVVRPYLASMTRGELMAMFTCVMATVSGTVMVIFANLVEPLVPGALGHILVASVVSVPAALVLAHAMVPDVESTDVSEVEAPEESEGTFDALMHGTAQGASIAVGVASTIIVLLALVFLINRALGYLPHPGDAPLTLEGIFATLFLPLVWLMGVPWEEAPVAANLLGVKTVMNEFVAYIRFSEIDPATLSERTRVLITYALCGFANFGSLGILLGGLRTILPERRKELASLGFKSLFAGTLATLMTAAVAGVLN